MTYGQIATLLHNRLSPRAVGWALHGCPRDVPWQRVINASGGFSTERLPDIPLGLQRALLEAEGVALRANGTVDLDRYRWAGPPSARPRARRKAPPAARAARDGARPDRTGAGPGRKR